jgi:hypothetical protein
VNGDVLYATRWNTTTRRPIVGHRWLEEGEARGIYESASGDFVVVDAAVRDEAGLPCARWVIGIGTSGGIRVRFFTPAGSIWRSTDYDVIDGRLWRWISRDYTYPDDARRYWRSESTFQIASQFRPDGTGTVDFIDHSKPDVDRARLTEAPVSGFWMDRPVFGQWDQLADPDYGIPPETPGV